MSEFKKEKQENEVMMTSKIENLREPYIVP